MATATISLDIIGGADLPGELTDVEGWEDEVLETCERCFEPTGWGEQYGGRLLCPPCVRYAQQSARNAARTLVGAAA